jgi:hypothetical protein
MNTRTYLDLLLKIRDDQDVAVLYTIEEILK